MSFEKNIKQWISQTRLCNAGEIKYTVFEILSLLLDFRRKEAKQICLNLIKFLSASTTRLSLLFYSSMCTMHNAVI